MPRACCHFTDRGVIGAPITVLHFPLPELIPVTRAEALRWLPVKDPDELPLVAELPVNRPETLRYAERLELMGDAFSVVRLHADHGDVAEEVSALVPGLDATDLD